MAAIAIEEEVLGLLPQLNLDQLGHVHGELNLPEIMDSARRTKKNLLRNHDPYFLVDLYACYSCIGTL